MLIIINLRYIIAMSAIDSSSSQPLQLSLCVPPGDTLLEIIEYLDITQKELALRTGLSEQSINKIIKGKSVISADTADKLAYITRMPAHFWVKLEQNYRDAQKQLKLQQDEDADKAKTFLRGFPYADLVQMGLCPDTRNLSQKREALLNFFGVAGEDEFQRTYIKSIGGAARVGFSKSWNAKAFASWLRVGELLTHPMQTAPFNLDTLKCVVPQVRELVAHNPAKVWGKIQNLLASAGVAAVLVREFKDTHVFGYSRFVRSDKAILQLSMRGGRVSTFWFNLFHELAHLLKHGKRKIFVNLDSSDEGKSDGALSDFDERSANKFSRNLLIPPDRWQHFIIACPHPNVTMVREFAKKINVSPDVVLRRLQTEGLVPYNRFARLAEWLKDMPVVYPPSLCLS